MDVVWLKKDVRLHDHAPLSLIAAGGNCRPCLILYLYEPDQLSEATVHGSHVAFVNEGLVDLDLRLSGRGGSIADDDIDLYRHHQFRCITVCHAGAAFTFREIHRQRPIHQILCHMETSHLKSFARDKAVRRWCRANNVPIKEFNQTGVTRCLSNRDDFSANFNRFLDRPMPESPSSDQLRQMRRRLIDVGGAEGIQLHGLCRSPMNPTDMQEISAQNRHDRANRQRGGESKALDMFQSFLSHRGANYSSGISSPNTSWTTGSRLSPYLTWGHMSLRHVIVHTKRRQEELRSAKKVSSSPIPWLRSLASFQSRMHWRSHFMQKLESQPSLEKEDLCLAFSKLRRQPHDFCQEHYDAWCQGLTGFPFVDACMRCLIDCGWLNFRMRAMLVSFATYNLWLDWKKISCHLARVFLDYEPGIHYPQLQMQAGTTGINAMRVYNVTKQGKDQDPSGIFIRRYIPELRNVPDEYIHEPYNMPSSMQKKYLVTIGNGDDKVARLGFSNLKQTLSGVYEETDGNNFLYYPSPIVDEKLTAKLAKDKLSTVRKQESTKVEADQVFLKHGSRRSRGEDRDGVKPKALSSAIKRVRVDRGQTSLLSSWKFSPHEQQNSSERNEKTVDNGVLDKKPTAMSQASFRTESSQAAMTEPREWSCKLCTYLNEKPLALVCSMCGSVRQ
ncbi:hypothetical protein ACHAXA_003688 [Cyclostephanos tholiformis]|uniref:Photolyase/cryptochrome alpha/beta domain-containing protein n=1 Tax=Cyclostephanos tholiformis TaxID=382380 RepID=A0ABD3RZ60_9STRA